MSGKPKRAWMCVCLYAKGQLRWALREGIWEGEKLEQVLENLMGVFREPLDALTVEFLDKPGTIRSYRIEGRQLLPK